MGVIGARSSFSQSLDLQSRSFAILCFTSSSLSPSTASITHPDQDNVPRELPFDLEEVVVAGDANGAASSLIALGLQMEGDDI
jgi:hypothetical protein